MTALGFAPECTCDTATARYHVKADVFAAAILDVEERDEVLCDFCAHQLGDLGYEVTPCQ